MRTDYKLICVDMFQTLVDVHPRRFIASERMLKEHYTKSLGEECWAEATRLILAYFGSHDTIHEEFETVKQGFSACYEKLWKSLALPLDARESAQILAQEHGQALPYPDALPFLEKLAGSYPVCLVTDADMDMVDPHLSRFRFDKVFISEKERCYKSDGALLARALAHFDVAPNQVLHIGDGYSDVLGAKTLGLDVCWLNRHNKAWQHAVKPDYIVAGLDELGGLTEASNRV